jgi:SMP-30/Gluconolactonase/LRE-like region
MFNQQRLRTNCCRALLTVATLCLFSTSVFAHPGSGIVVDGLGQSTFLTQAQVYGISTTRVIWLSKTLFHWLALDANNRFASSPFPRDASGEIQTVGTDPAVLLSSDWPIAIGQDGNLYYQSGRRGSLKVMRMIPSGSTSVFATLPATVTGKPLSDLNGITAGPDGSLYYTEDTAIRRISAQGRISTVARVRIPANAPSIPATNQHPYLRGLAVDATGVMYVADTGDAQVLKITPNGKVTTLLQLQSPWSPTAVALFGSDVYVLEFLHTVADVRKEWLPRVRKLAPDGTDRTKQEGQRLTLH